VGEIEVLGEGEVEGDGDAPVFVTDGDADTMIAGPFSREHPAAGIAHIIASTATRAAPRHPARVVIVSTPVAARRGPRRAWHGDPIVTRVTRVSEERAREGGRRVASRTEKEPRRRAHKTDMFH
jgi:hypothetical protein